MARLQVNWSLPQQADRALVQIRQYPNGTWRSLGEQRGKSLDVPNLVKGMYEVAVHTVSTAGATQPLSHAAKNTITLNGQATRPTAPSGFGCAQNGEYVDFKWTSPSTPNAQDGIVYEIRRGIAWSGSALVGDKITGDSYQWPWPFSGSTLTFRLKAKDSGGNYSGEHTANLKIAPLENYVSGTSNDDFSGSWAGTTSHVETDGANLRLEVLPSLATDWTSTATSYTGVYPFMRTWPSGTYTTAAIDLGTVRQTRIECRVEGEVTPTTSTRFANDYIGIPVTGPDDGDDDEASPHPLQGYPASGDDRPLDVDIDISTSDDDATYTDFRPFVAGVYNTRYLKMKTTLRTRTGLDYPTLTSMRTTERKKNRKREGGPITVTTTGVSITFDPPFFDVPALVVRVHNSDNHLDISDLTATGADITVANTAHQAVNGIIDWIAAGT